MPQRNRHLPAIRRAWLALAAALAIHVADEAKHDFLSVYNPAVTRIREAVPFLPLPTFTFGTWVSGLLIAVIALSGLGCRASSGSRWVVPVGYAFAVLMAVNGLVHILVTTVQHRLMPGTISAPLLILGAAYLIWALRMEATQA